MHILERFAVGGNVARLAYGIKTFKIVAVTIVFYAVEPGVETVGSYRRELFARRNRNGEEIVAAVVGDKYERINLFIFG